MFKNSHPFLVIYSHNIFLLILQMQNIINGYYDRFEDVIDLHLRENVLDRDVAGYRALEVVRIDPFNDYLCDRQFKARYRFNKRNCNQFVNMLLQFYDINNDRRGQPATPSKLFVQD